MKDWDTLYKTEKDPFGAEPSLLVKNFLDKLQKNQPVLDLGCGSGRNALYLAKEGFRVTCVDISPEAVSTLLLKAEKMSVKDKIKPVIQDVSEFDDWGKYGLIVCYTTLHFLSDTDARQLINDMKGHTTGMGLNIIADFAGDGPLKRDNGHFWLANDELKSLYNGWKLLLYEEELSKTKATDDSGNPFMQNIARLVAQKPEEIHFSFQTNN